MRRELSHLLPRNYPGNATFKEPVFPPSSTNASGNGCSASSSRRAYETYRIESKLLNKCALSNRNRDAHRGRVAKCILLPRRERFVRRSDRFFTSRVQRFVLFLDTAAQWVGKYAYIRRSYNISPSPSGYSLAGDSALSRGAAPLYTPYRDENVKRELYVRNRRGDG